MVFPTVMYRFEIRTIKNSEHQRIDAFKLCGFKLWCWRRTPWTARRSNQSTPKKSTLLIHWKDWCWRWSSNSLTTRWEVPTHWEKNMILGKLEFRGRSGWQRMKCLDSIIDSTDMSLFKLQEIVKDSKAWHAIVHRVAISYTRLSNWTTSNSFASHTNRTTAVYSEQNKLSHAPLATILFLDSGVSCSVLPSSC